MNKKYFFLSSVFLFVLALGLVSSFAVSSKYWEENPLEVSPGESQDFFVVLQNLAGEPENISVQGIITEGGEFVRFSDGLEFYEVPFGEKVQVNLNIDMPKDADVGESFIVVVSFKTMTGSESGEFGFGSSIEREIPIQVVESVKENKGHNLTYWAIAVFLAIVLILGVVYLKSRKKRK